MKEKSLGFTPGPWSYEYGAAYHAEKGRLILADRENDNTLPTERDANLRLCAAAPTIFGKLVDTVAWLDREIEDGKKHPYCVSVNDINRLEELRDDLQETLRKITGGE